MEQLIKKELADELVRMLKEDQAGRDGWQTKHKDPQRVKRVEAIDVAKA